MSEWRTSNWEAVTEAALKYAEAEAPDDFARARDYLRKAALRHALCCLLGRDREVRVRVCYVRPPQSHPCQLALWPARTFHDGA